jgi:hypothetical protein
MQIKDYLAIAGIVISMALASVGAAYTLGSHGPRINRLETSKADSSAFKLVLKQLDRIEQRLNKALDRRR